MAAIGWASQPCRMDYTARGSRRELGPVPNQVERERAQWIVSFLQSIGTIMSLRPL